MRGTSVIVTTEPRGVFEEGFGLAGETYKPGMIVQRDTSVDMQGGRWGYKIYNRAADGDRPLGAHWVVLEDKLRGHDPSSASYSGTNNDRLFLYSPIQGEEINLLLKNLTGTGDDHTIGEELMVDDGTGMLIATTGSPQLNVAQLLEAVTDPTADTLAWCQWGGAA